MARSGTLFIDWKQSGTCIDMHCTECGYSNTHFCSFGGMRAVQCPVCDSVYLLPGKEVLAEKLTIGQYDMPKTSTPGLSLEVEQYSYEVFMVPVDDNGTTANFQWKGGGIYCDFYCDCGGTSTLSNEWFVYSYQCPSCGSCFVMPNNLELWRGTREELMEQHDIEAVVFDIADEDNFRCDPYEQDEYRQARAAYLASKGLVL